MGTLDHFGFALYVALLKYSGSVFPSRSKVAVTWSRRSR